MAEPASGTAAAATTVLSTSAVTFTLGSLMPPGASVGEFIWGLIFSALGAFAYQFIEAQAMRQADAEKNVPIAERRRIDLYMLGYSICGAPMSAACLIFGIHQFHGGTGFGDTTWLQSAAGFMVAGAAGPKLVMKGVGAIVSFGSSWIGGWQRKSP